MNRFRLDPPRVCGQIAHFSWTVSPASTLYRKNEFSLAFPPSVDLARVPERAWGLVALLCLHPHWVLLRPCRVELPFHLAPGERALWYRLLEAAVTTLAAHAGRDDFDRDVEIAGIGAAWDAPARLPVSNRCATAFSGGKDSLLQTGLLAELTERPLLVATTSPLPSRDDHVTERRRYVFETVQHRRDVTFVEVESDFRAAVNFDFAHEVAGYPTSVTELTDTFLFFACLFVVSLAAGAPHLFQASEAEVQESVERDGRIIQHRHFMYSAATQQAVSSLIAPYGMRLSSLTSPLYASQVHRLLWTRYRDLSDLQYSCWRVSRGEATCSRCRACLEYALGVLALGDRPARMGLDLGKVVREVHDWAPRTIDAGNRAPTPTELASARASSHIMANARAATTASFLRAMLLDHPLEFTSPAGLDAIRCFRELKQRLDPLAPEAPPGFRPGFLHFLDPLLRERVGVIYAEHFDAERPDAYADLLGRSRRLADWISAPLGVQGRFA